MLVLVPLLLLLWHGQRFDGGGYAYLILNGSTPPSCVLKTRQSRRLDECSESIRPIIRGRMERYLRAEVGKG